MAIGSHIEWTDATWNPVTGCTKVSLGCKHCYAERMAKRLQKMGSARYTNAFNITLHEDLTDLPKKWKRPRRVFVNSMSDLFHDAVPEEFISRVFTTMEACPQHVFQVLTKRSDRLEQLSSRLPWPDNVWMGVSVENRKVVHRIPHLANTSAAIKFLSVEPLIGPLDNLPLNNIDWVIVGGESGPNARIMRAEWVETIYEQCKSANVAFFFKQWGGVQKHRTGRLLHGRTYDEMPNAYNKVINTEVLAAA